MSKYTKCFKCLEAVLDIDFDRVPAYDQFLGYFFELQMLETSEERKLDPRKYNNVLGEFKHLLAPKQYNLIVKDFYQNIKELKKIVLTTQDQNYQSPLHVASYFGDFKAARHMVELGADSNSAAYAERPLNVCRDKFVRGVLQNLNDAAEQNNVPDLQYLVNCGNKIDNKTSVFGEAPIHMVVESQH